MALHFKKGENEKKKGVGQLRRTQLITTFGSGAIVDMPDYSVIIAAINYWKNGPVLHERNLEKLLKVSKFIQPYASGSSETEYAPDIPAFRFPIMHFCPQCGALMPYWGFGGETGKKCPKCKKNIVPSRFIAACVNGHLEDFPYRWWVHQGDFSECPADHRDELKIIFSDETGGLESIIIKCTRCGKTRSMAGSMGKDALRGYHCKGKRPWIGMKSIYNDSEECSAPMHGLQRGASNVYFAQTESALTIPPWSNRLHQELDLKWDALTSVLNSHPDEQTLEMVIHGMFYELLATGAYTVNDVVRAVKLRDDPRYEDNYTRQNLYEDEYHMFCLGDYEQKDDFQFRTESAGVPEFLEKYIENVVLVRRLREVMALKGFRRISPEKPVSGEGKFEGYHVDGDWVPLSDTPLDWYPGIEMPGEGIFIKLKESELEKWEANNKARYYAMEKRLEESSIECENFSARYVLLHTLSHLLIRQLSIECGYSGASIKERIYSSYPESEHKMAGILIYTSSADSDGSLGGLVRNGLPGTFESIFRNMLQEASWCSSDPVCIDSMAQGYDSLNYAACHACTLLPETSCEMRNCLLDRGAVAGSIKDRRRGYFGAVLDFKT